MGEDIKKTTRPTSWASDTEVLMRDGNPTTKEHHDDRETSTTYSRALVKGARWAPPVRR